MKTKVILGIAITALLTSCETKETFYLELVEKDPTTDVTFSATIDNGTDSRTSLSANNGANYHFLYWTKGDAISIYDGTSISTFTTESDGMATGEFTRKSGDIKDDADLYTAFYPSSITVNSMTLPSEQTYVKDNVANYPMYAQSSDKELTFKNLCGIVRLSLKSQDADMVKVSKILLSAEGTGMSGRFSIDADGAAVVEGSDGVVLDCDSPVSLSVSEATDFNVIVPRGSYNPLNVSIYNAEGEGVCLMSNSVVKVERSGVTRISLTLTEASFDSSLEIIPITDANVDFSDR